jgi:ABC-type antimicrobial peptide transport system permease subunit
MEQYLSDSVAQSRFTALLLGGFAALALVLALVGVYGVTAYVVNQRAREIAVRLALGAQRHAVIAMIARQTLWYAVAGIVMGIAGAAASTRLMAGLLFGVTATDPLTFAAASAALMLAAMIAACIPAVRAARVTPVTVLRMS